MNRRVFATLAISTMFSVGWIAGCANQELTDLEVGPNDQVATYKVIDGM